MNHHGDDAYLDTDTLLADLYQLRAEYTLEEIQRVLTRMRHQIEQRGTTHGDIRSCPIPTAYLLNELSQIGSARTLERAHYYLDRLIKSITEERTSPINDINLNRWKTYTEIKTDSLWVEPRRDNSGAHMADYWGNFIPQIPHQMMLRYTRKGDWVLDTFAGSGTTLIEGKRLGRHTLGIELQESVAQQARDRVQHEPDVHGVTSTIVTGDCTSLDYHALVAQVGQKSVQLVLMHPPYYDIIKFSEDERDLANAGSLDDFLHKMGLVVEQSASVLGQGRYLVLVIGDKYAKGEWIPLGFLTMQEVLQHGFKLKSIVVKNFEETTGKRTQKELWRYRALVGGFYIFKHEYIFIFQKK